MPVIAGVTNQDMVFLQYQLNPEI